MSAIGNDASVRLTRAKLVTLHLFHITTMHDVAPSATDRQDNHVTNTPDELTSCPQIPAPKRLICPLSVDLCSVSGARLQTIHGQYVCSYMHFETSSPP
jgi:hypothetical protein